MQITNAPHTLFLNSQKNLWPLPNEITNLILQSLELSDLVAFGKSTNGNYKQTHKFAKKMAVHYGQEADKPFFFLKMFFKEVFAFINNHPSSKKMNLCTTSKSTKYKIFKVKVKKLNYNASLKYLATLNVFLNLLEHPNQFIEYPKITKYLIKNAKDLVSHSLINPADYQQKKYLFNAAKCGQNDVVEFLLDHGIQVDCRDKDASTPLHFACSQSQITTIELLLKRDADINLVNDKGRSALHLAYLNRDKKTAELLLKHGANEKILDQDGLTAHAALEKDIIFSL